MRTTIATGALTCALLCGDSLAAVPGLTPLVTFGGGDGWVAPGERTYLTTDTTQRGLAYNPVTGNLLVVNRSGGLSVNVLNGTTGANVGTLSLGSGISGGVFALNMIGAADDGAIYAANLTVNASSDPLRVYRWANESATPTMDYVGAAGFTSTRFGDTLDVRGSGASTQLLLGTSGQKGYAVLSASGGAPYTASAYPFQFQTPPFANDHQLGITFATGNTVVGTRGGLSNFTDLNPARYSSFDAPSETLLASPIFTSQGERPLDFAVIDGIPVVITVDTFTSIVRAYDFTNVDEPALFASLTNIAGASNANGNGVGQIRFGAITGDTATVYALNPNNGIQAFTLTVPEPAAGLGVMLIGGLFAGGRRRSR